MFDVSNIRFKPNASYKNIKGVKQCLYLDLHSFTMTDIVTVALMWRMAIEIFLHYPITYKGYRTERISHNAIPIIFPS